MPTRPWYLLYRQQLARERPGVLRSTRMQGLRSVRRSLIAFPDSLLSARRGRHDSGELRQASSRTSVHTAVVGGDNAVGWLQGIRMPRAVVVFFSLFVYFFVDGYTFSVNHHPSFLFHQCGLSPLWAFSCWELIFLCRWGKILVPPPPLYSRKACVCVCFVSRIWAPACSCG